MAKPKIKVGEKFGMLTLLEDLGVKEVGNKGRRLRVGLFQCECGNIKEIMTSKVKNGSTISCGCYHKKMVGDLFRTHGHRNHPLYRTWGDMYTRCTNPKADSYCYYGERGIKVCDEWRDDFMSFYNWAMDNGWEKGLQIDRIDVEGDYEPNNCQFITQAENCSTGKRRMKKDNTSGYNGVYKKGKKYSARITINKKETYLGTFETIEDAIEERIKIEIEFFGEQKTNFHYKKEDLK